ncbi:hypothetical protein BGZ68_003423, partial [Mortierella alpina]
MSNPRSNRGDHVNNPNIPNPEISNSESTRHAVTFGSIRNDNSSSAGPSNLGSAGPGNLGSAGPGNPGSAGHTNPGSAGHANLGSANLGNSGSTNVGSNNPGNRGFGSAGVDRRGHAAFDYGTGLFSDSEPRADWAIAIDNQCESLRNDMSEMEIRILKAVSNVVGSPIGNHHQPAGTHDPTRMRSPKPIIAESSEDEAYRADNQRAPSRYARPARRQDNYQPYLTRPEVPQYENIDLHRRSLERLKSYDGPTFVLSRRKGKYADDWIRGFDNWFRARVCDPHINDDVIRAGVIRLVMIAVAKHTEASEWCRNRIRERNITYESLMDDLSDTFMDLDEARRRIKIEFLQELPQTANERIVQYNVRFKARVDLHRAACARARRTPDERSLLSCYAGGLYDRNHGYIAVRQGTWENAMRHMKEIGSRCNEIELARKSSKTVPESDSEASDRNSEESTAEDDVVGKGKDRAKSPKETEQWESMQDGLKAVTDQLGTLTLLLSKQQKAPPARTPGAPLA